MLLAATRIMFFARTLRLFLNLTESRCERENLAQWFISDEYVQTFIMLNMMLPKSLNDRSNLISRYCKEREIENKSQLRKVLRTRMHFSACNCEWKCIASIRKFIFLDAEWKFDLFNQRTRSAGLGANNWGWLELKIMICNHLISGNWMTASD